MIADDFFTFTTLRTGPFHCQAVLKTFSFRAVLIQLSLMHVGNPIIDLTASTAINFIFVVLLGFILASPLI